MKKDPMLEATVHLSPRWSSHLHHPGFLRPFKIVGVYKNTSQIITTGKKVADNQNRNDQSRNGKRTRPSLPRRTI